jgi:hypothetical protein
MEGSPPGQAREMISRGDRVVCEGLGGNAGEYDSSEGLGHDEKILQSC